MKTFITLTERRGGCKVCLNVDLISKIKDLRTNPQCTPDFHFTVIHFGNDIVEVRETMEEILAMF